MPKANQYSTPGDAAADSKEERMARLKVELREHIRFLSDYEILSQDWLRMAESVNQIANVAFMETQLPPSQTNPLAMQGKKTTGTLWDQEKDELAVRILLEEGKLNLVLRLLHKFMEFKRAPDFDSRLAETSKKFNSEKKVVSDRCEIFESAVGVLLKFTLCHVEALQILDMPEFITHVGEVLAESYDISDQGQIREMQGVSVLYYLASIAINLDELQEDRIMTVMREKKVMERSLTHVTKHHAKIPAVALKQYCFFLNYAFQSDAFSTEPDIYLTGDEGKKALIGLKGLFVDKLVADGLAKKEIQTLLDIIGKYEAQYK